MGERIRLRSDPNSLASCLDRVWRGWAEFQSSEHTSFLYILLIECCYLVLEFYSMNVWRARQAKPKVPSYGKAVVVSLYTNSAVASSQLSCSHKPLTDLPPGSQDPPGQITQTSNQRDSPNIPLVASNSTSRAGDGGCKRVRLGPVQLRIVDRALFGLRAVRGVCEEIIGFGALGQICR